MDGMEIQRGEIGVLLEFAVDRVVSGFTVELWLRRKGQTAFVLPLALRPDGRTAFRFTEAADWGLAAMSVVDTYALELAFIAPPSAGFPDGQRFISDGQLELAVRAPRVAPQVL